MAYYQTINDELQVLNSMMNGITVWMFRGENIILTVPM